MKSCITFCVLFFICIVQARKWGTTIKYKFDRLDASLKSKVQAALSSMSSKTCLTFEEDSGVSGPHITFVYSSRPCYNETRNLASLYEGMFIAERMGRGEGHRSATGLCTLAKPYNMPGRETQGYSACYSHVGQQPRGNRIVLSKHCFYRGLGPVFKQLMHTLGFYNEISRSDRDQYITVNSDNIRPGFRHSFRKMPKTTNEVTDYDYLSVLHYLPKAFSKNGMDVIVTKDASYQQKIGKAKALSDLDVEKIKKNFCS